MYVPFHTLENVADVRISQAAESIDDNGIVIIDNVVPTPVLDTLRERMELDTSLLLARGAWGGAGQIKGHIQQSPPVTAPFVHETIVSNPVIMPIIREVLGDGFFMTLYSANVNTIGSSPQRPHADAGHLWFNTGVRRKHPIYHPATTLVVNIPLIDTTPENGSTEVYLGSHKNTEVEMWVPEALLHKYACRRANTTKGSVIIRDIRTWHRGMPNHSTSNRHMIAMIMNVWWLNRAKKNYFHVSARDAFKTPYFDPNAEFLDVEIDPTSAREDYFQIPYLFEGRHVHECQ
ncbi:MAG: phytanoyl-CoA dioxygenase family protein [Aquisalimonadaceae bacterium]